MVNLWERFADADDRVAIYELRYRLWPIVGGPLKFAGKRLVLSAATSA